MATWEQIQKAKDAGYSDDEIRAYLRKDIVDNMAPQPYKESMPRSLLRSVGQGGTLGFQDEMSGLLAGVKAKFQGQDFMSAYESMQQQEQMQARQFGQEHPAIDFGTQLATGMALPGIFALKSGAFATHSFLKAMAAGITTGAVSGAGYSDPGERGPGAAIGATIGAVTTPLLYGGTALVNKGIDKYKGYSLSKAQKMYLSKLKSDDMTTGDVKTMLSNLTKDASLADAGGDNITLLSQVLAKSPGTVRNKAKVFFEARQEGQSERLLDVVRKTVSPDDFLTKKNELIKSAQEKAAPYYKKSENVVMPWSKELINLTKSASFKNAMKDAVSKASDDLDTLSVKIDQQGNISNSQPLTIKYWDYVKRSLDDAITSEKASTVAGGKSDRLAQLVKLKYKLVDAIDNPDYKKALSLFSGEKQAEDSISLGYDFMNSTKEINWKQAYSNFNKMADSDKDMFKLGVAQSLRDKVMNTQITGDSSKKLFGTPAMKEKLRFAFDSTEDMNKFVKGVEAEGVYNYTMNRLLKGSQTFENLAGAQDLTQGVGMLTDISRGYYGAALMNVTKRTMIRLQGLNDEVKNELSDILFNSDRSKQLQFLTTLERKVINKEITQKQAQAIGQLFSIAGSAQANRLINQE